MHVLYTHIEDYSKESVIKKCTQFKFEQFNWNNHRQNNYLKGRPQAFKTTTPWGETWPKNRYEEEGRSTAITESLLFTGVDSDSSRKGHFADYGSPQRKQPGHLHKEEKMAFMKNQMKDFASEVNYKKDMCIKWNRFEVIYTYCIYASHNHEKRKLEDSHFLIASLTPEWQ